jgi:hypothetical protein
MSDSHKKRKRDDNDDVSKSCGHHRLWQSLIWRPCSFCRNHFTGYHDWAILWGPKGRAYAYLCMKCQNKWKYGEKDANEMDKKDDKKDDQKDDKKDDMDKNEKSMIVNG